MKRLLILLLCVAHFSLFSFQFSYASAHAQGWPSDYPGVMLQGFYWNSYADTKWTKLEAQANELAENFDLIWVPQSGWCGSMTNMGYTPQYYWNQRSAFGTEAELRSMIQAFKQRGTGIIADVVVNHREPTNGWFGYPVETYQGETYQMLSTDICRNDDNGEALTEANKQGVSLSANNDTGEGWNGCRDLDHKSDNVRHIIKAYTRYLIDDLGYTGFRYDMVKGFSAQYVTEYNQYAKPQFSVGEYWDSNNNIKNWIRGTQDQSGIPASAAFDFQFRYNVRDAINRGSWAYLKTDNRLIADNYYKPYAVTFVENHDTEYRSANDQQDPIRKDTLQANAFLLAMPGTPCVFLKHWIDLKDEIKLMIEARRLVGITNTSSYTTKNISTQYYAAEVTGHHTNLLFVVGNRSSVGTLTFDDSYQEIINGDGYRYLVAKRDEFNKAWLDKASGAYYGEVDVRAIALTNNPNARLVYTTDGSTPTANSTAIESNEEIHLTHSCTLTLGLLVGGTVVDITQKNYEIEEFTPHTATIYCRPLATIKSTWNNIYYYLWTNDGKELNGNWPGKQITETEEIGGQTWYKQTVDITTPKMVVNAVFNTGNGLQTVDVTDITQDAYFVIKPTKDEAGHNEVNDLTITVGIDDIKQKDLSNKNESTYDLSGRRISHPAKGLYIRNEKKYIVR